MVIDYQHNLSPNSQTAMPKSSLWRERKRLSSTQRGTLESMRKSPTTTSSQLRMKRFLASVALLDVGDI